MKKPIILESIFLLITLLLLPWTNFGTWGDDFTFLEAIKRMTDDIRFPPPLAFLIMFLLILEIVLFILAVTQSRVPCIVFSAIGMSVLSVIAIIITLPLLIEYGLSAFDQIPLVFWITLWLFIRCFCRSLEPSPHQQYSHSYSENLSKISQTLNSSTPADSWVCKTCGEINSKLSSGCKKCGNRR